MNPFERHGINHLSPFSLRLYREEPAAWTWRYLKGIKDEAGPGAWRGQAVELAMDHVLKGNPDIAPAAMIRAFEEKAQGLADDKTAAERANLAAFLKQAQEGLGHWNTDTVPLSQHRVSLTIPELEVPIIGYCDWIWEGESGIDLKTTWRLPSQSLPEHVEQVAVYSTVTGLPFYLCYVTPKKRALYQVTKREVDEAMVRVKRGALALRAMLDKCANADEAVSIFSPNMESWHWTPELRLAATKFYEGGEK